MYAQILMRRQGDNRQPALPTGPWCNLGANFGQARRYRNAETAVSPGHVWTVFT